MEEGVGRGREVYMGGVGEEMEMERKRGMGWMWGGVCFRMKGIDVGGKVVWKLEWRKVGGKGMKGVVNNG